MTDILKRLKEYPEEVMRFNSLMAEKGYEIIAISSYYMSSVNIVILNGCVEVDGIIDCMNMITKDEVVKIISEKTEFDRDACWKIVHNAEKNISLMFMQYNGREFVTHNVFLEHRPSKWEPSSDIFMDDMPYENFSSDYVIAYFSFDNNPASILSDVYLSFKKTS